MRRYKNLPEFLSETERDLWELGVNVKLKTMQNKCVEDDDELGLTKELTGYSFQIADLSVKDFKEYFNKFFKGQKDFDKEMEWVEKEFSERISPEMVNPGTAWELRKNLWESLFSKEDPEKFDYTYNERFNNYNQLERLINYLKSDLNTRRANLSVWSADLDLLGLEEGKRVPCSLSYTFQFREGKLNLFYVMRSSDFYEHLVNDILLANKLLVYVSEKIGVPSGSVTLFLMSLHAYYKDLKLREIF